MELISLRLSKKNDSMVGAAASYRPCYTNLSQETTYALARHSAVSDYLWRSVRRGVASYGICFPLVLGTHQGVWPLFFNRIDCVDTVLHRDHDGG